jgi:hypothetical protein
MLQLSQELTSLGIYLAVSLIVTFLADFLASRHLLKEAGPVPESPRDEKPERTTIWGVGLFPGVLAFAFLSVPTFLDMTNQDMGALFILISSILLIAASFSGGWLASHITKQKVQVDFEHETSGADL